MKTYIKSATSGNYKIYVEFYPYERFKSSGRKKKVTVSGTNLKDALTKMVSRMQLYLYPEDIEEENMSSEDIIESLLSSNGDGCDYIVKLTDKTSGTTLIDEYDPVEEYEDEWY